MKPKLKIAIQKSGRLFDDSMRILKEAGIEFNNGVNKLKSEAVNFPMEVFFFRDDDIPQYVEDGIADAGIVGENVIFEKQRNVTVIDRLGFGKCRLSIAIPKDQNYNAAADLFGKRIATSYPRIVSNFFNERAIPVEIHEISGSVEIATGVGLADAICDLVSSGSTLFMNGLRETEVLLRSEAALIMNPVLQQDQLDILEKLRFRMHAVKKAKNNKYILLNAPNARLDEICRIIPGMKSPTILPLATPGWSSVHSVVNENDFWVVIEKLKENGAQGILVVPIEKMLL